MADITFDEDKILENIIKENIKYKDRFRFRQQNWNYLKKFGYFAEKKYEKEKNTLCPKKKILYNIYNAIINK